MAIAGLSLFVAVPAKILADDGEWISNQYDPGVPYGNDRYDLAFRGRAAYYLYPHRVFFDPLSNELQWTDELRPGDWLLVYQQREIQYDASRQMLRWETGRTTSAELKLIEPGAALFRMR